MSDPIIFKEHGCPVCGGDVMADESMEGGSFTDGEYAFCASNCGWFGSVCVVEDGGEAFPSTASELEPIIERLEDAKGQEAIAKAKLRHVCEIMATLGNPGLNDVLLEMHAYLFPERSAVRSFASHQASNPSDQRAGEPTPQNTKTDDAGSAASSC